MRLTAAYLSNLQHTSIFSILIFIYGPYNLTKPSKTLKSYNISESKHIRNMAKVIKIVFMHFCSCNSIHKRISHMKSTINNLNNCAKIYA